MTDLKNVLEVVNSILVLPIVIITFLLLIYVVVYLNRKDADVVRSRIFLKYRKFKNSFLLLAVFAFLLIFHVSFIYFHNIFDDPLLEDLQHLFGIILALSLVTFVGTIIISLK
jgi:hypothetical protein